MGACLLHGVRDLPRSRTEPTSPALEGGFYTMEPPRRQQGLVCNLSICSFILPTHLCLSFPATHLSVHPLPTFPSTICLVSIYSSTHPIHLLTHLSVHSAISLSVHPPSTHLASRLHPFFFLPPRHS